MFHYTINTINLIHPIDADLMLAMLTRCWTSIGSMHRVRNHWSGLLQSGVFSFRLHAPIMMWKVGTKEWITVPDMLNSTFTTSSVFYKMKLALSMSRWSWCPRVDSDKTTYADRQKCEAEWGPRPTEFKWMSTTQCGVWATHANYFGSLRSWDVLLIFHRIILTNYQFAHVTV